jgi:hypothetical protein
VSQSTRRLHRFAASFRNEAAFVAFFGQVFLRLSKSYYSSVENFLLDLRKPLAETFFPTFDVPVFALLLEMLEEGLPRYQIFILQILHSLLLHTDVHSSRLIELKGAKLFSVTTLLAKRTELWHHAVLVLDVAVHLCKQVDPSTLVRPLDSSDSTQKRSSRVLRGRPFGKSVKRSIQALNSILAMSQEGTMFESASASLQGSSTDFESFFSEDQGVAAPHGSQSSHNVFSQEDSVEEVLDDLNRSDLDFEELLRQKMVQVSSTPSRYLSQCSS